MQKVRKSYNNQCNDSSKMYQSNPVVDPASTAKSLNGDALSDVKESSSKF